MKFNCSGVGVNNTIDRCRFIGNVSEGGTAGMFVIGGSPTITNSLFSGNTNLVFGDTVFVRLTDGMTLSNNTVVNNVNEQYYVCAGFNIHSSTNYTVSNSIFWGNRTGVESGQNLGIDRVQLYVVEPAEAAVSNSIIENLGANVTGTSLTNADPVFADADGADDIFGTLDDDPTPTSGSPAVDAGDNTLVPIGIVLDVLSAARFVDDPNTIDTGVGTVPIVDIGAYELQVDLACSPGDVTTTGAAFGDPGYGEPDGQITGADIQFFVNAWIAGDAAVADVTTTGAGIGDPGFGVPDGQVTGADLQYYVNIWIAGCP